MRSHSVLPCTAEGAVTTELAHFFPRCITDSPGLCLANRPSGLLRAGPGSWAWGDPSADARTAVHQHVEMSG